MMYGIHDFGFINHDDELAYLQKIKGKKVRCFSLAELESLMKSGKKNA